MVTFSKYHGLGNDFILFDDPEGKLELSTEQIRHLCHRQLGIGADGILIRVSPRFSEGTRAGDHRMLLFNADGTPAEISGNGLRCFVLFLKERGYDVSKELLIETGGGPQRARLIDDHTVESTMPSPTFSSTSPDKVKPGRRLLIGWKSDTPEQRQERLERQLARVFSEAFERPRAFELREQDLTFSVIPVSVGNPHGVIFGPERDIPFAEKYGPGLEKNSAFPHGANIEFVHVLDNCSCKLVVWERGAGITLACGSGSVATACAGAAAGHFAFDQPIAVNQPGGTLHITVGKDFKEIRQRGPAEFVFRGEIPM